VELWTRTAANEAAQTSIGKQFKQTLDLGDSSRLGYVVFVGGPDAAPACTRVAAAAGCACSNQAPLLRCSSQQMLCACA
jgi:hypothetical protein